MKGTKRHRHTLLGKRNVTCYGLSQLAMEQLSNRSQEHIREIYNSNLDRFKVARIGSCISEDTVKSILCQFQGVCDIPV